MSSLTRPIGRTQALEAQLGRISSKLQRLRNHVEGSEPGITMGDLPVYDVVRQDHGSFPSGDDWDSQFDDESIDNRVHHFMPTASGEISRICCNHQAVRLKIRYTSQSDSPILMKLAGSFFGFGTVQIKSNGDLMEYTDGDWIPISQVAPPVVNELVVMVDATGSDLDISLDGMLFDGVNRKWVPY